MEITNLSHIQSSKNIQGLRHTTVGQTNTDANYSAGARKDTVSFSNEALRLSEIANVQTESPRIRFDLVNRVKAEIAAGTYDSQDKMDIAIERMASRVF